MFIRNVLISFLLGKVSHELDQQEMLTPLRATCTVQNILKGETRLLSYKAYAKLTPVICNYM